MGRIHRLETVLWWPITHRLLLFKIHLGGLVSLVAWGVGWFLLHLGHETIATFAVDDRTTLRITAEGAAHYEPPGYLSFEVRRGGRVLIPERSFLGVGPERVPHGRFALLTCPGSSVVAVTHNGTYTGLKTIYVLCDLKTREVWPGLYGQSDRKDDEFGRRGFEAIRACHPDATYSADLAR